MDHKICGFVCQGNLCSTLFQIHNHHPVRIPCPVIGEWWRFGNIHPDSGQHGHLEHAAESRFILLTRTEDRQPPLNGLAENIVFRRDPTAGDTDGQNLLLGIRSGEVCLNGCRQLRDFSGTWKARDIGREPGRFQRFLDIGL